MIWRTMSIIPKESSSLSMRTGPSSERLTALSLPHTKSGVLEMEAHAVNASTWGVTYQVPDNPVATLKFGKIKGRFLYHDGRIKELTGGVGNMSIRQWHAYPNILPRELYSDEVKSGEKFETL